MDLGAYFRAGKELVDQALADSFPEGAELPQQLREALAYTLEGEGKRFRAILVFAVADTLGADRRRVIPIGRPR